MHSDINTVTISGQLSYDPHLGFTKKGQPWGAFKIRVNRVVGTFESSALVSIVAFGDAGANLSAMGLQPGDRVLVVGNIGSRKDKEGKYETNISADSIVKLPRDGDAGGGSGRGSAQDDGDDIPF